MSGGQRFVLVANQARVDPGIRLDDLPGLGGRFDLVARFVNATLLTSHGIREDASATILFTRPEEPVAMRIHGSDVTGIGPDERSTAARLAQALAPVAMPVWQEAQDGIETRQIELTDLLDEAEPPITLLHEQGQPIGDSHLERGTFFLGDHEGFSDEQLVLLEKAADEVASLGSIPLQADHVAAILHHEISRATGAG